MTLYEVDLDKLAEPVKSMKEGSSKRKAKEPKEPKAPKAPRETKEPKEPKEPKEKKPRAKKVKVETVSAKVEEVAPKVEGPTADELAADKAENEEIEREVKAMVDEMTVKATPKKPRAPREKKDPTKPPQWFAKYVEGVKKEQATLKPEKVAPKQIKEEAKEAASKSWNNGLTRNRVENEVNGHMSRMYSMIFSK